MEQVSNDIIISNFISPNNDNYNDNWIIGGLDLSTVNVFIYNNFGNLVYESRGYLNDWNGTSYGNRLPAGVYFYIVQTEQGDYRGTITLIR